MQTDLIMASLAAAGALALAGGASAAPVAMQKNLEHPHAGISLAVPEGFVYQSPAELYDVMRAVLTRGGKAVQAVTLSALPLGPGNTAEGFADAMVADHKRNLAIRYLEVFKKVPMPVAGLTGVAQRFAYTFRGVRRVAVQVYFVREVALPKNTKLLICYMLTVEADAASKDRLLPVLGEVIKTAKLVALRHPRDVPVTELGEPMEDKARGYSIRPPRGWVAARTSTGIALSQTDYLLGGVPMPTVSVLVGAAPAGLTGKNHAAEYLRMARKAATERRLSAKVLSEGPAALGGVEGFQFVLSESPETRPAADPGAGKRVLIIHRIACPPAAGDRPAASYSLVLICQDGEAKALEAVMERIAEGFRFLDPVREPTTATAPTETRPTADERNR